MGVAALFAAMIVGLHSTAGASENVVLDAAASAGKEVIIRPGEDVRAIISSNPAGTTFSFEPGLYRLSSRNFVETGDSFIGRGPGVVLNGARLLTHWQQDHNGRYYVTGQKQAGVLKFDPNWTPCESGYERCIHPEDLFVDRVPYRHATSYNKLAPGSWYFDYDADRIYLYDNPAGKMVETSVIDFALIGLAHNVTIKNLTVEMFASPSQTGAIQANGSDIHVSSGWVIDNVTARFNHGMGVNLIGHRHRITNSRMVWNALKGLGGGGTTKTQGEDILVENNELAYNNWGRAAQNFDCCGVKVVRTDRVIIRGNVAHHNYGKGIWTDIDNRHALIERNVAYQNASNGIYHEISWDAIIRENWSGYNGHLDGDTKGVYYAQILVVNSSNVEVTGNTVVVDRRGNAIGLQQNTRSEENSLRFGKPRTNKVSVHHNTIIFTQANSNGNAGLSATMEQDTAYQSGNNRFDHNTYHVVNTGDMANKRFIWRSGTTNDVNMDWSGFRAAGQEINGQLVMGFPSSKLFAPLPQWAQALESAPSCHEMILQTGPDRRELVRLKNGDQYEVDASRKGYTFNVVAVCNQNVESVKFEVNGEAMPLENVVPYELVGDAAPRVFAPGRYVISMTPADLDYNRGFLGQPMRLTLHVYDTVVVLPTQTNTTAPTTLAPTAPAATAPSATEPAVVPIDTPVATQPGVTTDPLPEATMTPIRKIKILIEIWTEVVWPTATSVAPTTSLSARTP